MMTGILTDVEDERPSDAVVLTVNGRNRALASVIQEVGRSPEFDLRFTFSTNWEGVRATSVSSEDFSDLGPGRFQRNHDSATVFLSSDSLSQFHPSRATFLEARGALAESVRNQIRRQINPGEES